MSANISSKVGEPVDWRVFYPNLSLPDGLTFEDVRGAAQLVHDWQLNEQTPVELVVKVYEYLAAAAANPGRS